MRTGRLVVPLTLAVLLASCQDGTAPNTDPISVSPDQPLAAQIVDRTRFFHDGFLVHVTPEVTFTVGLVDPRKLWKSAAAPPAKLSKLISEALTRLWQHHRVP